MQDNQQIHLTDAGRILLGRVPVTFLIEAMIRIGVLYALLIVAMRLMGKRMSSQITRNELAALVSLAAATGPVVQSPERGLLPPFVIALVLLGVQRAVAVGTFRSARFEQATQGDIAILVRNGEVDLEALRKVVLSRERLFAHLRAHQILNLGRVERVYLEAGGTFSFRTFEDERPGLSLIPSWDTDFVAEQRRAEGQVACASCGHLDTHPASEARRCDHCDHVAWEPAILA